MSPVVRISGLDAPRNGLGGVPKGQRIEWRREGDPGPFIHVGYVDLGRNTSPILRNGNKGRA